MIFKCDNKEDYKRLKQNAHILNVYCPPGVYRFPFYVNSNSWQDIDINGSWYCKEAENMYNKATPVPLNLDQHPELLI